MRARAVRCSPGRTTPPTRPRSLSSATRRSRRARGLSGLRDGQPDQVLLKCGDTWTLSDQITLTKSANSATQYMVLGSYGAGPRPKIRTPSHGIFGGNSAPRNGFAIVGIDLAPI